MKSRLTKKQKKELLGSQSGIRVPTPPKGGPMGGKRKYSRKKKHKDEEEE